MFSTVVFGVSLTGLVVLFVCKTLELSKNVTTPLQGIRQAIDPVLTEGWARYRAMFGKMVHLAMYTFAMWVNTGLRKTMAVFDTTAHGVASKLNRYLRTRRLHMRHGDEVSAHLKTVLEKTKQDSERHDPL